MADQSSKDAAAKARIISHMNADHHDSIVRYLEHHGKLSSWAAYDGEMTSVDLTGMTLVGGGIRHRIPFLPALTSFAQARERLVQMDNDSLKALGRSDVVVTQYPIPTGIDAARLLGIAAVFVAYSQRWWFADGGLVEPYVGTGFARFSYAIQPYLITFLILVHGTEAIHFALFKLPKFSVNPRSLAFWLWTAASFIEGQFTYMRFDKYVQKKRAAKEKQKH